MVMIIRPHNPCCVSPLQIMILPQNLSHFSAGVGGAIVVWGSSKCVSCNIFVVPLSTRFLSLYIKLIFIFQIMRNLLGTHLGHSGVYTMCNVLEDR